MEKIYGDERELLKMVVQEDKTVDELNQFYKSKYKSEDVVRETLRLGYIDIRLLSLIDSLRTKGYIDKSSQIFKCDQGCCIKSIYATSDGKAYFEWEEDQDKIKNIQTSNVQIITGDVVNSEIANGHKVEQSIDRKEKPSNSWFEKYMWPLLSAIIVSLVTALFAWLGLK